MAATASHLSQENILRDVHDPVTQTLRTSATATIGTVNVDIDFMTDSVGVGDPVTGHMLKVNANGSVDTNVILSHADDSVRLGDGTNFTNVTAAGALMVDSSHVTQPVSVLGLPLPAGAATSALQTDSNTKLDSLLAELQQKADLTETQPVSILSLPLPTGAATSALQSTTILALADILTELSQKADVTDTQPVSLAALPLPTGAATETTQEAILTELQSPNFIVGTEDGTTTGTQHVFVNNMKSMILASADRQKTVEYYDISSKKNRRVNYFEWTSPTFPGVTLRKNFIYQLVGNEYINIDENYELI